MDHISVIFVHWISVYFVMEHVDVDKKELSAPLRGLTAKSLVTGVFPQ